MCEPGPGSCWSLLPRGDGWEAAATAVSLFPHAGPQAVPAEPMSAAGTSDPVCGVAAQSLKVLLYLIPCCLPIPGKEQWVPVLSIPSVPQAGDS